MNYKNLAKALKYYHETFEHVLNSMNHNDWSANERADFTKRRVLADLYKEMMGDQGRDEEADEGVRLLEQNRPVMYHEGRIVPAHIAYTVATTGSHSTNALNLTPYERLRMVREVKALEHHSNSPYRAIYHPNYPEYYRFDPKKDIRDEIDPTLVHRAGVQHFFGPHEAGGFESRPSFQIRREFLVPEKHPEFVNPSQRPVKNIETGEIT